MNRSLRMIFFSCLLLVSSAGMPQDNLTPADELEMGMMTSNSKMVANAIARSAPIGLEQVLSSISLLNLPDGKEP